MLSTFLNIICYSIGSLLWGVVIGAICMALFFLLIKGWWKDAVMSLSTYIVGGILGILLMFQCTLICGSLAIMRKANQFEALATEAIEQMVTSGKATLNEIVDQAETQEGLEDVEILENQYNDCLCRTQILVDAPGLADYFLRSPIGNHHVIIPERRQ